MNKTALWALISVAMLAMVSSFFILNRRVQAVNIQVNTKSLPEHGLIIISPSDPSFDNELASIVKDEPNTFVESFKPFSALLKNTGNKTVVAYCLKWEMVKTDGTIVPRVIAESTPTALMDGGPPNLEHLSTSGGYTIAPNSVRFVSPFPSLGQGTGGGIGGYIGDSADHRTIAAFQKAARDKSLSATFDIIRKELQSYTSVTVSIDGAFFEDGIFIGPDSTQFFARLKTRIDAKHDLLDEIAFAIKHNRNMEEIFSYMEEVTQSPEKVTEQASIATDYNYFKRLAAEEILRMRNIWGDQKAIAIAIQSLRKPWPQIRKQ